jgi:hypothetical protein
MSDISTKTMWRTVAGVIAGNLAWTMVWLGLNVGLRSQGLLPGDPTERIESATPLLIMLIASVVFSIAAGWIATAIAPGAGYVPAILLAVIQLGLGIFFQSQAWQLVPLWYHLPFLVLIVPATLLGARLRLR